jgi:hypothetical protein
LLPFAPRARGRARPPVRSRWLLAITVVLLFGLPALTRAAPAVAFPSTELIVHFREQSAFRRSLPRAVLEAQVARQAGGGLRDRASLDTRPALAVFTYDDAASARAALRELRRNPDVLAVEPSVTRELAWEPDDDSYGEQAWWLDQINAPDAWDMTSGAETTVVAVIDSGVSPTHPDLSARLVPGYNAIDGSDNAADVDGHGTHVAGIIAAQGNNLVGTAGVAMDVRIMPVRVVDDAGEIDVADVIEGIYWAVDHGADVLNLSLGDSEYAQLERDAIVSAYNQGVVVVAAGGNNFNEISYPGNYDEVIAVGALTADGAATSFTSRLTRVDVAAPGESIFSPGWDSFYGDYWDDVFYADFTPVSGTSFSTAMVSGAIALVRSVAPGMGIEEIRALLERTATDVGDPGPEAGIGAGRLDVGRALNEAVYAAMQGTWHEADSPVSNGAVRRTWLWGQAPFGWAYEPYVETQHGTRLVYYYDKSRMEVTDPLHDRGDQWYVTNGLLATELITGKMQLGDNTFEQLAPATVGVAGDPDDTSGPLYASFEARLWSPAIEAGASILLTIDRDGQVNADSALARYGVTAGEYVPETGHRVASVFWDYLNSSGVIAEGDALIVGRLFEPWFYATGFPITEAYWARVKVAGIVQDVLVQCFERRCLTYTPSNATGWQVEMGNVGRHYYVWRYGSSTADTSLDRAAARTVRAEQHVSLRQLWRSTGR